MKKKYDEAFEVIAKDNTSPAITGTICNHNCQYKCTRLDYDESVLIRDMKKVAVLNSEDKYIENIKEANIRSDKKSSGYRSWSSRIVSRAILEKKWRRCNCNG